jgi:hypothetical protein
MIIYIKMRKFDFSKYCTPAQLYLVLGVIGIISGFFANYSVETLLTESLFLVIWAWVLNWLCSKGFKAISWILVLLPFILVLFTYFFIKEVAVKEGITIGGQGGRPKVPSIFDRFRKPSPQPAPADQGAAEKAAAEKAAAEKAAADKAAAESKAAADKAAAEAKAAADKAAADQAIADAKAKACLACGAITSAKKKNECNQKNQC